MLAAFIKGSEVALEEAPKPQLENDSDVILKVSAASICTSDVHFTRGYLPPSPPWIFGHEFCGVVEQIGRAVTEIKVGDRVLPPPVAYCGSCPNCRAGHNGFCFNAALFGSGDSFGGLSGGMAEYVRVPNADSALLKIPDEVDDERAVYVADMLATGYFAVREAGVTLGDTVAVVGAGPVGMCAVHVARLYSPSKIILIGRRTNRLKVGVEMGATHAIDSDGDDVAEQVSELTDGHGVTAVIETAGKPGAIRTAAQIVKLGGTMSLVSAYPGDKFEFPMQTVNMKSLKIRGGLTDVTQGRVLMDLVVAGKLDPRPLTTHRVPLTKLEEAFSIFAEKREDVIKVMVRP